MENRGETKGLIFNIQKFSIHDGAGIRTLIFLKGCPLRCIWCCNPESQSYEKEVMFVQKNCFACGTCAAVCPRQGIDLETFQIDRKACDACGTCAKTCYANAKKVVGKWQSVYEIMEKIEQDRIFYHNSGGGVTIGGGEPTAQPQFTAELLNACKKSNLHTAMETCGHGPWEKIKSIFPYLDQVFFDLKHMDEKRHRALTGVGNKLILENAKNVAELGCDITFRIPLVPGCNDDQENIRKTGEFVRKLAGDSGRIRLELLPYHGLGSDKYVWLDQSYQLSELQSSGKEQKQDYNELLRIMGCQVVD